MVNHEAAGEGNELPSGIESYQTPPKERRLRFIPGFLRRLSTGESSLESSGEEPVSDLLPALETPPPADLHADILMGLEKGFQEVPRLVCAGIIPNGLNTKKGFELLNNTSSSAEVTTGGRAVLEERMRQDIVDNLEPGLNSAIGRGLKDVERGIVPALAIKTGHENIRRFFALANEAGVPLGAAPEIYGDESGSDRSLVPISAIEDQVHADFDRRVNERLPSGLGAQIERLGSDVGIGIVTTIPGNRRMIEEVVQIIEQRGFASVDEERGVEDGLDQLGVIPAVIDRQAIDVAINEQIRANLSKGIQKLVDRFEGNIRHGSPSPFSGVSDGQIDLFRSLGENCGVVDTSLDSLVEGLNFNPNLVEGSLALAVRENIGEGLEYLIAKYGRSIQLGSIRYTGVCFETVEEYIAIAQRFGVPIDEQDIRRRVDEQVTPQLIQEGMEVVLESLRKKLQKGDFYMADSSKQDIESVQELIHRHGLGADQSVQLALQQLAKAYEEAGIELPQLADHARG